MTVMETMRSHSPPMKAPRKQNPQIARQSGPGLTAPCVTGEVWNQICCWTFAAASNLVWKHAFETLGAIVFESLDVAAESASFLR
mmetsp:Transcript_11350/g.25223  ORF Transcript_11350/g.25223 Transcript_11350/m.25223 type:complete len:85 (-) Transcript_11350:467-721(-)